jgi:hypothetical protein
MGSASSLLRANFVAEFHEEYAKSKELPDDEFLLKMQIFAKKIIGVPDVIEVVSSQQVEFEKEEVRNARNREFQIACGKFDKASKGADQNKAMQLLASEKVDIDSVDEDGWSALFHSAGEGHSKIATFLIENKANVDLKDEFNCTPLWVAAFNNQRDVVKVLLLFGADDTIAGKPDGEPNQTPSLAARRNRHPGLADYIDGESALRKEDATRIEKQKRGEMTMEEFNKSLRSFLDKKPSVDA